jgi:hypothetical protein
LEFLDIGYFYWVENMRSAALLMLLSFVSPASASLEIVPIGLLGDPIPGSNDFIANLTAQGFDRIVQGNVTINATGTLDFYAHAQESGFTNSFSVGGFSYTESPAINSWIEPGILISSAPIQVTAGMLLNNLLLSALFTTTGSGGLNAAITSDGFGIFAEETADGGTFIGPYTRLFFGYDDNGAGPDDDHDDLIVSVLFTPLAQAASVSHNPEPSSLIVWGGLISATVLATRGRRRNRDC